MSYNDFYCCNTTFWVNRSKRKYKDVERELAKARAKKGHKKGWLLSQELKVKTRIKKPKKPFDIRKLF